MAKDKADNKKKNWVRCNEQIKIPQVTVIQDGNNLGQMLTKDALVLARSLGLDLVEVAAHSKPPVCRIMDYGKFMYEKGKKEKQKHAGKKEKEVSFRYVIDEHDLETKVKKCEDFLKKGMKVKLVVVFKERQKAHKDLGFDVLEKVIEKLKDVASVEQEPRFEGGNVIARVDIKKESKKNELQGS